MSLNKLRRIWLQEGAVQKQTKTQKHSLYTPRLNVSKFAIVMNWNEFSPKAKTIWVFLYVNSFPFVFDSRFYPRRGRRIKFNEAFSTETMYLKFFNFTLEHLSSLISITKWFRAAIIKFDVNVISSEENFNSLQVKYIFLRT